jgi:hypothetical protein
MQGIIVQQAAFGSDGQSKRDATDHSFRQLSSATTVHQSPTPIIVWPAALS